MPAPSSPAGNPLPMYPGLTLSAPFHHARPDKVDQPSAGPSNQLSEIHRNIEKLEESLRKMFAEMRSPLDELKKEVTGLEENFAQLKGGSAQFQGDMEGLINDMDALNAKMEKVLAAALQRTTHYPTTLYPNTSGDVNPGSS